MSRNLLIIAAALLIILVAGWYFLSNKETSPSTTVQENLVTITSNGFTPQTITIKVGDSVTWTNTNSSMHNVISDIHPTHQLYPPLNLGNISAGESKSLSFPEIGTYKYHDHLNPSLTGTVIVE